MCFSDEFEISNKEMLVYLKDCNRYRWRNKSIENISRMWKKCVILKSSTNAVEIRNKFPIDVDEERIRPENMYS